MTYFLYNLALLLLSPAIAIFLLYRIFVSGKSRKSWWQQIGLVRLPKEIDGRDKIWIHAVSVGESVASAQVISEIKNALPDAAIVVSTTTETGQEMARKSIRDADAFIYYPFDLAPFVSRSIRCVRPRVFASTDTEIWPNFRHIARGLGVKTTIINGTISDKTIAGARKIPWLYKWTMSNIHLLCMQSQADADRAIALGADPSNVIVTGNCKADQPADNLSDIEIAELRSQYKLPANARVFVAGSTNPGEDASVIEAFIAARNVYSGLRLIIAPRQIERREEIADIAREMGLQCGWRSDPASISGEEDVLILDTFGELARVYAIAGASFVGGSLIPRGCHSILQPISHGKPVFFGPYTFKAKDLVAQAKAAGVGFEVADGVDLGEKLTYILGDSARLDDIRVRCEKMMQANRGASRRTAEALVKLYGVSGAVS
ncbi:MAG: glycosyltransferase N-terminal domain-containing protein [Armatimonadota bacterium]|nr:3-deoxy-D-manno-octulosonic acid transferase [bacterium]